MAVTTQQLQLAWASPAGLRGFFTAVYHRTIGVRFIVTAFVFFVIGGIESIVMRLQLAQPSADVLSAEQYNQLFTMHGSTMMFLFAVPIMEGFAIYLLPLMFGARDMPFPRANAFGYWAFLFGGIFLYFSFLTGNMPDGGWFAYVPLTGPEYSPGINMDYWLLGIALVEISAIIAAIEIIVGTFKTRAPGMSINRMPLFAWNVLAVAFAILFAFPALVAGTLLLELDRAAGFAFFDVARGGTPILWQHLFWIFGHPEVYIMFLPAVGFVSMIVPTFSRRPIVGYTFVALAAVATAFLSFGLWVHHMFAAGLPWLALSFFSAASFMIAIPSGIQVFAWIATLWTGRPVMNTALLFVIGFLVIFVLGGITGVMVAAVPFDWQVHDTFFVVAHFHYVLIGGVVFPLFAALYYWLPKMTGKLLSERVGYWNFGLMFAGFNLTFFPMHFTGLLGMPRRVYTYEAGLGWDFLNLLSTIGAFVLSAGIFLFILNFFWSLSRGKEAGDNPWAASTLEWATSSPPPVYNFAKLPAVQSRDPLWDGSDIFAPVSESYAPGDLSKAHNLRRETLATTPLDADPDVVLGLPMPTYTPLISALGAAAIFAGILVEIYAISVIGVAVCVLGLSVWHWHPEPVETSLPDDPRSEFRAVHFRKGIFPDRPALGWLGMCCFLIAVGAFLMSLLFGYFIVWANSTSWPLDQIARPNLLVPLAATAVLIVSAIPVYLADAGNTSRRSRKTTFGLGASFVLGATFIALLALDYSRVDFTPRTNAYGSLYFTLTGFVAANLVVVLIINCWSQIQGWLGMLGERRRLPLEVHSLYWYFVIIAWLLVFAVVYLVPYLGATSEQVVI